MAAELFGSRNKKKDSVKAKKAAVKTKQGLDFASIDNIDLFDIVYFED